MPSASKPSSPRVWYITGASTGFGRTITEIALRNGDIVAATLRKPEAIADLTAKYPADRLIALKLDVTNEDDIRSTFAETKKIFGRIDIVFNNAGSTIIGEIEGTPNDLARSLFDVNFWGAANVTREAVKNLRENTPSGGLLLQVVSECGFAGLPTMGYYGASKFAIEGLTEAFIGEMDPKWNIKVSMLEPGPFRTNFQGSGVYLPVHPAYADPSSTPSVVRAALVSPAFINGDMLKATEAFYKVSLMEDPPLHLPLHKTSVAAAKKKAKILQECAEKYESWSEDIYL